MPPISYSASTKNPNTAQETANHPASATLPRGIPTCLHRHLLGKQSLRRMCETTVLDVFYGRRTHHPPGWLLDRQTGPESARGFPELPRDLRGAARTGAPDVRSLRSERWGNLDLMDWLRSSLATADDVRSKISKAACPLAQHM